MKILHCSLGVALLSSFLPCSFAGYHVTTQVEPSENGYRYVWTVDNLDQSSSGLDVFVVAVPIHTIPLAHSVPPPWSSPEGSGARWVFFESREAQVDPNGGRTWLAAPPPGLKWLVWVGEQPPSVYPTGTSTSFSLTTDSSLKPGSVNAVATSYTPQNHPHYYEPFFGEIVGPGSAALDSEHLALLARVQFRSTASPQLAQSIPESVPLAASLDVYPGVTIEGEIGRTYGIQFVTDLQRGDWQGLVNVTLQSAKQVWFDPQSATNERRFYRVVQGPVPIDFKPVEKR